MKQCKVLVRLELNKHRNVILERFWLCQFSAYKYHVPGGYSSLLGINFLNSESKPDASRGGIEDIAPKCVFRRSCRGYSTKFLP